MEAKTTMNITTSMTASAHIKIEETAVVYLSADLSTDGGNDRVTQSVQNKELYDANKTEIREQIKRFQDEVYKMQDSIEAQNKEEM